jgi:hypothetical protein
LLSKPWVPPHIPDLCRTAIQALGDAEHWITGHYDRGPLQIAINIGEHNRSHENSNGLDEFANDKLSNV